MPEALDIEDPAALLAYLRHSGRVEPDEQPQIAVLPGGVSNRTVWVKRESGEAWVLKQALAKLRVATDWFSSPERIHREALGLEWLGRLAPGSTPRLIFEDRARFLLAMEAVPQPHVNWKTLLLAGQVGLAHVRQFAELLAAIHGPARGRTDLAEVFGDRSFFESLRLDPYYSYSAAQEPAAAEFLRRLMADTLACRMTLVHGDYSPKNILVRNDRLILLDHEVIHYGDPAFDVGFSMTHLLSKAHHMAEHRREFLNAAREYWRTYWAALGWAAEIEARGVRHTLACLLARAVGQSPLEYLNSAERVRQRDAALEIIPRAPETMPDLIGTFEEQLCR